MKIKQVKTENGVIRKEDEELTVYIKIMKGKNQILQQNHKCVIKSDFYYTTFFSILNL